MGGIHHKRQKINMIKVKNYQIKNNLSKQINPQFNQIVKPRVLTGKYQTIIKSIISKLIKIFNLISKN